MPAIDELKAFDVANATLSLWIFKKSAPKGQPPVFTGRWVDTADELDAVLKEAVTNEQQRLEETPDYTVLAQNNEASALLIDTVETHAGLIVDEVANQVAGKKTTKLKDIQNAKFYVIKLVGADGTVIHAVAQTDASWRTKKKLGFISAVFDDEQMGLEDKTTFSISRSVDFFIVGDSLLICSKKHFETILNYKQHHQEDFTALQAEPAFLAVFSDLAPMVAHVGQNKMHLRRMTAIKQKGHYRDADFMHNLRAQCAAYGLNLVFDADGRIVPTPETCRDIFLALLDHRLKSGFSSNLYDVTDTKTVTL